MWSLVIVLAGKWVVALLLREEKYTFESSD
jgi:hypothetical protein